MNHFLTWTFQIAVKGDNFIEDVISVQQKRQDYMYSQTGKNISDNFKCQLCEKVTAVNAYYNFREKAICEYLNYF